MSHSNLAYSGSNHMLAEMDAEAGDILLPVTRRCSSVNDLTANLLSPSVRGYLKVPYFVS